MSSSQMDTEKDLHRIAEATRTEEGTFTPFKKRKTVIEAETVDEDEEEFSYQDVAPPGYSPLKETEDFLSQS